MKSKKLIITIDGPTAAGKGTIAYLVARKYGLINLDSGSMYRAVAWLAQEHQVPVDALHQPHILKLLAGYAIEFEPNAEQDGPKSFVKVGGKDITGLIRTESLSRVVPVIGAMIQVRSVVTGLQRQMANHSARGVVAEGRDTGSVVFPDADLKFFLTSTPEVRAQRRHAELVEQGSRLSLEQVYSDLQERDRHDTERAYSALRVAEDAQVIDSTLLSIEQVVERVSESVDALHRRF